ncbi:MAG TPA: molybdopterin-dependent oxidoreductase [Myxococcales bacterium]|nr:molybdopterin-dependent oxidoreductase [Myxococcales bacterium]
MPQEFEVVAPLESEGRRVLSADPANAEAAPDAFEALITPAGQRFLRCHFAVPDLGEDHEIEISGAVVRPGRLTLQQLNALPSVTRTVLTECAGNSRASLEPAVPGEQWTSGAVSTAQWTGVPLRSVLDLRDTAVEVVFTGADTGAYQRSLPREVALDPGTLLACEMNGQRIPAPFGGPVRLVVPDWYGMASVKWVARIEAVEEPFHGEFQSHRYVYAPGVPVTRIRIKSMFTQVPAVVRAGAPVRIAGLVWGGDGVRRVDVEIDGEPHEARLVGPALPHAWRRFELEWVPAARGRHVLACRAADQLGESQPDEAEWNPLGYGNNAVQRAEVVAT